MKSQVRLIGALALVFGLVGVGQAQQVAGGTTVATMAATTATTPAVSSTPATPAVPSLAQAPAVAAVNKDVIKPGDRNCLQSTGSLIPAKPGHCLSGPGRSYSQQDIRDTGRIDTARALQQLDPSISVGR